MVFVCVHVLGAMSQSPQAGMSSMSLRRQHMARVGERRREGRSEEGESGAQRVL